MDGFLETQVNGSVAHDDGPGTADAHPHAAGCMFCTGELDPENSLDGDGVALSEHLALREDCRNEWRMWKQAVVDEWHAD